MTKEQLFASLYKIIWQRMTWDDILDLARHVGYPSDELTNYSKLFSIIYRKGVEAGKSNGHIHAEYVLLIDAVFSERAFPFLHKFEADQAWAYYLKLHNFEDEEFAIKHGRPRPYAHT